MRSLILGSLLLLTAESVALACSCAGPANAGEARSLARAALVRAVAVVEVEVLSEYDERRRLGEQVRVRRILAGWAPANFWVHRGGFPPSSAACHLELTKSERRILILYPVQKGRSRGGEYGSHGLCSDVLVRSPHYLRVTVEEAQRRLLTGGG